MIRTTYENGLPFKSNTHDNPESAFFGQERIRVFLEEQKQNIIKKKGSVFMIDGSSGSGKTTLAIHFAEYIEGRPIVFEEQVANGTEDFQRKFVESYKKGYNVLVYDEAGDADRKQTMSKMNRAISNVFRQMRAFRMIVIVCLPRFYGLESDLLQSGNIRALIHVNRNDMSRARFKMYRMSQFMHIKNWVKKLPNPMDCYKYGHYQGVGEFLDLPPKRSAELENYSIGKKIVSIERTVTKNEGMVSGHEVAEYFGKSHRWVQLKLRDIEQVSTKTVNRIKYYDRSIIKKIEEATA